MAYGHPNIKAGKRMVVALENYGGRPSIAFRVARDLQQQLLEDRRYFVPKFGEKEGWICISVQEGVTQREIDGLIEAAYSAAADAAPKRAAAAPRARKSKATSSRRKTRAQ